jgi:hypothetical protein
MPDDLSDYFEIDTMYAANKVDLVETTSPASKNSKAKPKTDSKYVTEESVRVICSEGKNGTGLNDLIDNLGPGNDLVLTGKGDDVIVLDPEAVPVGVTNTKVIYAGDGEDTIHLTGDRSKYNITFADEKIIITHKDRPDFKAEVFGAEKLNSGYTKQRGDDNARFHALWEKNKYDFSITDKQLIAEIGEERAKKAYSLYDTEKVTDLMTKAKTSGPGADLAAVNTAKLEQAREDFFRAGGRLDDDKRPEVNAPWATVGRIIKSFTLGGGKAIED